MILHGPPTLSPGILEMRWVKMNLNNNQSYHTNHKLGDLAYQDTTFVMTAEIHKVNREVNHSTHIMVTG